MKKTLLYILFALTGFNGFCTTPSDSIKTVYSDGVFSTHYQLKICASNKIMSDVSDFLVTDFHDSPGNLFNWALKDLGLQNQNNEVIIVFKSSENDDKTGITHGVFDIIVPHFTTFQNVKVDAIVGKTRFTNGESKVTANIIYSSLLLKNALATLTIIPQKNNEQLLVTNVDIRFGWFFNLFITKRRYKSIVEWRIKKFTENIKDECLQRQNAEFVKTKSKPVKNL